MLHTWSKAANGMYWNTDFIDGYPFYKLEERAIQSRMDIESLVNVFAFYMKRNPELIITIENPVGLLCHHPVDQLFYKVIGLSGVTISYCMFSTQNEQYPVKNTDLWTNSSSLLSEFKDASSVVRKIHADARQIISKFNQIDAAHTQEKHADALAHFLVRLLCF